jgi:hypothetical protein
MIPIMISDFTGNVHYIKAEKPMDTIMDLQDVNFFIHGGLPVSLKVVTH